MTTKYNFLFQDSIRELRLLSPYKLTIKVENYDDDKFVEKIIQENDSVCLPTDLIDFIHKNNEFKEYAFLFSDDYYLYFSIALECDINIDGDKNELVCIKEFNEINVKTLKTLLYYRELV